MVREYSHFVPKIEEEVQFLPQKSGNYLLETCLNPVGVERSVGFYLSFRLNDVD